MKAAIGRQNKRFYEFGPFRVDSVKRRLLREGQPVPLTPKAFDTLIVLLEHRGQPVEKDELIEAVWPDTAVEENNLTQNIYALRKALGDSPNESRYILTVQGWGYRFVADVIEVTGGDTELIAQEHTRTRIVIEEEHSDERAGIAEPPASRKDESVGSVTASVNQPVMPGGKAVANARREAPAMFRVLLVGVVLAALAFALYVLLSGAKRPVPASPINSIVVLPLENLSGDAAQEYFADGVTDAVIGELGKIEALRVISRTSAMNYKGTKKKLPEIASELNVDGVVEGTVVRSGDRVQVRVQLIRAASDQHLWSETYDYDLRDVLALQSDVARAIAREIQAKTTPAEQLRLADTRPVNRKALDDYLQGRNHQNKSTEEHIHKAIEYFKSAISADPTYAPAYAGLAKCYNSLGSVTIGALPPTEARRRGEEAAAKALELDSGLAEAHVAMGYAKKYNWDWAAAEQAFKRAIELNPSNGDAHNYYARYLTSVGRAEEAVAEMDIAQQLDPLSLHISAHGGFVLLCARRYDEAIEQLRRVLAIDPNHPIARGNLGQAYVAKGQYDDAIAIFEKVAAHRARAPGALGFLGMSYGLAGRKDEANQVLKELLELGRRRYVTPAAVASVYIGLGNKDQAFAWLEKAYQEHSNYLAYLKVFPLVDPLRSDPRFDELLRRIGLAP